MDAAPAESITSTPAPERAVVLMREAWVKRVAAFISSAGTAEEARLEGRPEIVFSKIDQTGLPVHYSDFNVRSRHFRCLESFFVETDGAGRITGLVTVDGLRSNKRILNVNLLLMEPGPEPVAARLRELLSGAVRAIQEFVPIAKLRLLYIFDHSFSAPLGAHVAPVLIDAFDAAGLFEEARIANETGPGREAVLLGFLAPAGGRRERMTVYRASADGLVMGITAVVVIILGAIAVGGFAGALLTRLPGFLRLVLLFPAVLCLSILAVAYAYTPRAFKLGDDALVVSRLAGDVTVPLRDVSEVRAVPNPLSGSMRLGGNGGLFGFWGRYYSAALKGNFTLYGTRASGGVALVGPDQTVVITPDDPDQFVTDIQRRLGRRVAS